MSKLFKRFNDIDIDYIYTDKHIHSNWTDGKGTILQIAKKADKLGLNHIAITEHIRADSAYFSKYLAEIKKVNRRCRVDILAGFEAKICNFYGDIDISYDVLKKVKVKIASVHRFPIGRKLYYPRQFKKRICQEIELELSIRALKKGRFNVLGHPGGMSLKTYHEFPLDYFEEIILECKRNDVVFEINSSYHLPVLNGLVDLLSKHDVFVSLGSDAHKLKDVGSYTEILGKIING